MWWLLVSAAVAHPFGATAAAHRLDATINKNGLVANWSFDVPNVVILAGSDAPEVAFAKMQAEILSGVAVRADGEDLVTAKILGEPTRSDESSFIFPVTLKARWHVPPTELVFEDGNLIDLRGFFRSDIKIGPGLAVVSSTLLPTTEDGEVIVDHSGRWREGKEHRRIGMRLVERWSRGQSRPIGEARLQNSDWRGLALWTAGTLLLLLIGVSLRRVSSARAS